MVGVNFEFVYIGNINYLVFFKQVVVGNVFVFVVFQVLCSILFGEDYVVWVLCKFIVLGVIVVFGCNQFFCIRLESCDFFVFFFNFINLLYG